MTNCSCGIHKEIGTTGAVNFWVDFAFTQVTGYFGQAIPEAWEAHHGHTAPTSQANLTDTPESWGACSRRWWASSSHMKRHRITH